MDNDIENVAKTLVSNFKGILAADESMGTIEKRFASIGISNTDENRRSYRELLFTAPGVEEYISGVILFDETIRQSSSEGVPFPKLLSDRGIIPGIKVDEGKIDFPDHPGESITKGIEGLKERLDEYKKLGAKFTKWRAVIAIGPGIPSQECIEANTIELCKFAQITQDAGMVPIVEPEVLMDGDHDIIRCEDITRATLTTLFAHLKEYQVNLRGLLLKPNMILPGKKYSGEQVSSGTIATVTLSAFERTIPPEVPGIVFLSGGQSPEEATVNLNAINQKKDGLPWELSFSYGRALQEPVLKTWNGDNANKNIAQATFLKRAKLNSLARKGEYTPDLEK
jgi:fructose-bisphosphate aldolase, class I